MKRIMKLMAALAISMMAASCTKIERNNITDILIDVPQKSWGYSNQEDNNFFYATVSVPELNSTALRKGLVNIYRVWDANTKKELQAILPCVRHREVPVLDGMAYYTETVDFEFQNGQITFYYTASDFDYEIDQTFVPEAMTFRCVILY